MVEISEEVIQLNTGILYHLNGKYMTNKSVQLIKGDFLQYVKETNNRYDIICMDIDNGPMFLVNHHNKDVYNKNF